MGLFDFLKGNSSNTSHAPISTQNSMELLNLSRLNLDKTIEVLNLNKGLDLHKLRCRVGYVGDYSGSTESLYRRGEVQRILQRILPLALKFDDNGELDSWIFENGFHRLNGITLSNYENYVTNEIIKHTEYRMGGTEYVPVLKDVIKKYFVEDSSDHTPVFLMFLTDGDNDRREKEKATALIRESAGYPIFIQFIGIGHDSFEYLETLDNLSGRKVDNTGFIKVKDMNELSDEQLYTKLLEQFPDWLKATGIM